MWSDAEARALLGLIRTVTAHRDRERLFGDLGDAIAALVPMDALAVVLEGPGPDQISPFVVHPPTPFPPLRRSESGLRHVFDTGKPRMLPDRDLIPEPGSRAAMERLGMRSFVALPLQVRESVIGVLVLHSRRAHAFDDLDTRLADEIAMIVATALDRCLVYEELERSRLRLAADNAVLRDELGSDRGVARLAGDSRALREVVRLVELVAPTDATVLIEGETGTGKELVARAIHETSARADRPLVTLNCAAIPTGLVEAELFGHEPGAFTDAARRRKGRFEAAHGGTLFLDEIGELPPDAQAKLLRVLQHRQLERIGGGETIEVDVRVIAATNRDLLEAVEAGRFRSDLYYRLAVFPLRTPPLRDRRGDIAILARRFVAASAVRLGKRAPSIDDAALSLLTEYEWPGNVRELENVMERATILSFGARLEVELIFGESPRDADPPDDGARDRITNALAATGGIVEGATGAAARLGMAPSTLRSRMKKLGIKPEVK